MNPSAPTAAAREATRAECAMHERMAALAAAGRFVEAAALRDALASLSVTRAMLAAQEHTRALRDRESRGARHPLLAIADREHNHLCLVIDLHAGHPRGMGGAPAGDPETGSYLGPAGRAAELHPFARPTRLPSDRARGHEGEDTCRGRDAAVVADRSPRSADAPGARVFPLTSLAHREPSFTTGDAA